MIGILIALQINDWNDQNKDRKTETEYYLRLKIELEGNIKNLNDQISFSEFQLNNYDILAKALKEGVVKKDSQLLFIAIEQLGKTYPIEYSNNVWTELLYNGNSSLIRNTEFRDKYTSLYSDLNQTILFQDELESYNLGFAKLTGDVLNLELRKTINENMHPARGMNENIIENLPNQKKIINELRMLKGLNGYLAEIYQSKSVNKYKFSKHKRIILELIEICNKELGN